MLQIKGKTLDKFAELYGMKRKRFLLIFKESDKKLRQRIKDSLDFREKFFRNPFQL